MRVGGFQHIAQRPVKSMTACGRAPTRPQAELLRSPFHVTSMRVAEAAAAVSIAAALGDAHQLQDFSPLQMLSSCSVIALDVVVQQRSDCTSNLAII